jgi:hypothetical protein
VKLTVLNNKNPLIIKPKGIKHMPNDIEKLNRLFDTLKVEVTAIFCLTALLKLADIRLQEIKTNKPTMMRLEMGYAAQYPEAYFLQTTLCFTPNYQREAQMMTEPLSTIFCAYTAAIRVIESSKSTSTEFLSEIKLARQSNCATANLFTASLEEQTASADSRATCLAKSEKMLSDTFGKSNSSTFKDIKEHLTILSAAAKHEVSLLRGVTSDEAHRKSI